MLCVDKDGKCCYIREVYDLQPGASIKEDRVYVDYLKLTFVYKVKME